MPLSFSENVNECVPLRILAEDRSFGSRLGGHPPQGIRAHALPDSRYFATISLSTNPTKEASFFFAMSGDAVTARSGVIHDSLFEVIVHGVSSRSVNGGPLAVLPGHALELLPSTTDTVLDDDGQATVELRHKLGGRPYLIHNEEEIELAIGALSGAGYRHVLQFDFPAGGEDAIVDGPWPFADGMFHLFGRRSGAKWDWRWFWDL